MTPRSMTNPENASVLAEAEAIVHGPRQADYGTPLDNHQRTANLWNAYLATAGEERPAPLSPRDVCMLNILQKISRDRFCPKRDNLVDIAGYAENARMCAAAAPVEVAPVTASEIVAADLFACNVAAQDEVIRDYEAKLRVSDETIDELKEPAADQKEEIEDAECRGFERGLRESLTPREPEIDELGRFDAMFNGKPLSNCSDKELAQALVDGEADGWDRFCVAVRKEQKRRQPADKTSNGAMEGDGS